ncbi:hypothetical protein KJ359_000310 [Pestalotiopsis sp. 9143b]|nr:hypothetical protein KJ359_000310 [Pestalotiopsis sp. 9143b]
MAQTDENGLKAQIKGQLETLRVVLPRVPLILRVALLHILRMSDGAKYLDLRSDVTVAFLRNLIGGSTPTPISKLQAMTLKDPGVQGRVWVSTTSSGVPPETGIRDALMAAVNGTKKDLVAADEDCRVPELVSVEAEWMGYRAGATSNSKPPSISEQDKYAEMMKEVKSDVTVLHLHGGAYYMLDPASYRPWCKKLAKITKGRVYSVRYRLAPQHPFPSGILDALVSYFTLLYPPPEAVHKPVDASNIVFSGDSAGGGLSLALLQTLLEIRRQNIKINWFGQERDVPLPAGLALLSPWVDAVQSLPSLITNLKWDYLPPPSLLSINVPSDSIWPASPPRRHIYVDDAYLLHPLASLQLADSWEGSPPIYICTGWECLADEDKYLSSKLTKDGVTVVFEEYEGMPHVFPFLLGQLPGSKKCLDEITKFITSAVENPSSVTSKYTCVKAKTCDESEIDIKSLSPYTIEELTKLAYEAIEKKPEISKTPLKL